MSATIESSEAVAASFKSAMRRLAATVNIVTTVADGKPVGMAATAVTSLSMRPPSLLVCVNADASIHSAILKSRRFCVNILSSAQAGICDYFGGRYSQDERFSTTRWDLSDDGLPYLSEAQSAVFCELADQIEHGTHTVFIGNVQSVRLAGEVSPLVFADGRYCFVQYPNSARDAQSPRSPK